MVLLKRNKAHDTAAHPPQACSLLIAYVPTAQNQYLVNAVLSRRQDGDLDLLALRNGEIGHGFTHSDSNGKRCSLSSTHSQRDLRSFLTFSPILSELLVAFSRSSHSMEAFSRPGERSLIKSPPLLPTMRNGSLWIARNSS